MEIFGPNTFFWTVLTPFYLIPSIFPDSYTHDTQMLPSFFVHSSQHGPWTIRVCAMFSMRIVNVRIFDLSTRYSRKRWRIFSTMLLLFSLEFHTLNRSHRNIIDENHPKSKIWNQSGRRVGVSSHLTFHVFFLLSVNDRMPLRLAFEISNISIHACNFFFFSFSHSPTSWCRCCCCLWWYPLCNCLPLFPNRNHDRTKKNAIDSF